MTLKLNLILVIQQEKDFSSYFIIYSSKGLIAIAIAAITANGGTTSYQV